MVGALTELLYWVQEASGVMRILPQSESFSCVLNAQQELKSLPLRILSSASSLAPVHHLPTVSEVSIPLFS